MKFNLNEFKNFYFASSKYAEQEKLLDAFLYEWQSMNKTTWKDGWLVHMDYSLVKEKFNAKMKSDLKVRLQGKGFSTQGIEGLFRCLTKWVNAHL